MWWVWWHWFRFSLIISAEEFRMQGFSFDFWDRLYEIIYFFLFFWGFFFQCQARLDLYCILVLFLKAEKLVFSWLQVFSFFRVFSEQSAGQCYNPFLDICEGFNEQEVFLAVQVLKYDYHLCINLTFIRKLSTLCYVSLVISH